MDKSLLDRLQIEEATEGFRNGLPISPGVLALNSFHARHAVWNPPSGKRFRTLKNIISDWRQEHVSLPLNDLDP